MISNISSSASRWLGLTVVAASICAAGICAGDPPSGEGWAEVEHKGNLTIYSRSRPGTDIKENCAVGTIDAPNWVIKNVLDDVENYPSFMPYIVETKVINRNAAKHTQIVYSRMDPPLVDPRDYTLLVQNETRKAADGSTTLISHWTPANDRGPAEKSGTVRVNLNEGSWVLESIDGGEHTRGTYTLFTDGGGGIPVFLFNNLSKRRLNELFEALGKQSKDAKYHQNKPAMP